MKRLAVILTLSSFAGLGFASESFAQAGAPPWLEKHNGFDLSFSLIPKREILPGGPPKDGIPALTNPDHVATDEAGYLSPEDLVIGVSFNGEARAYPLRILVWHENVNDVVGGRPIAVTYCPLCNSAFVFDRRIGGSVREFGVSGLLWNSNVLLYDRQSDPKEESLWSQINMRAVTGPAAKAGLKMTLLPAVLTTWGEWKTKLPKTRVLSNRTGYPRNYGAQPYRSYFATDRLMFPARLQTRRPNRFKFKEPMVLVQVGEAFRAYAVTDVAKAAGGDSFVEDVLEGQKLRLTYLERGNTVRVEAIGGPPEGVPVAYTYWFALSALMPEVEIYEPPRTSR